MRRGEGPGKGQRRVTRPFYRAIRDGRQIDTAYATARAAAARYASVVITLATRPRDALPRPFELRPREVAAPLVSRAGTFVGRESERRALWNATEPERRRSGFVVVSGDRGAGKTALVRWLVDCRLLRGDNAALITGSAYFPPAGSGDVLRTIMTRMSDVPGHGKGNQRAFERFEHRLGDLFVPDRVLFAFADALERAGRSSPLTIVLDDAGMLPDAAFDGLARAAEACPSVCFVAVDPPALPDELIAHEIHLGPIAPGAFPAVMRSYLLARGHRADVADRHVDSFTRLAVLPRTFATIELLARQLGDQA